MIVSAILVNVIVPTLAAYIGKNGVVERGMPSELLDRRHCTISVYISLQKTGDRNTNVCCMSIPEFAVSRAPVTRVGRNAKSSIRCCNCHKQRSSQKAAMQIEGLSCRVSFLFLVCAFCDSKRSTRRLHGGGPWTCIEANHAHTTIWSPTTIETNWAATRSLPWCIGTLETLQVLGPSLEFRASHPP